MKTSKDLAQYSYRSAGKMKLGGVCLISFITPLYSKKNEQILLKMKEGQDFQRLIENGK